MASTDSLPIPRKNIAYRAVFPILDADGDLVTGASGLDSEVSKDQGTFADCTNEATEIATNSGMYYLDLTSTEMNADCVAVIVKTSTSGAKTTPLVFYPLEDGDWRVNLVQILGTAAATPATAGVLDVNVKNMNNVAATPITTIKAVQGLATDGVIPTATNLTNAPTNGDLTATMKTSVKTQVTDGLNVDTYAEPGQEAPPATTTLVKKIGYLYKMFRNKKTQTATTFSLFADDTTTVDQKATVSDDATTATRGEVATGP